MCTGALTPFVYENEMIKAEVVEIIQEKLQQPSRRRIRWRPIVEGNAKPQARGSKTPVRSSSNPKLELATQVPRPPVPSRGENLAARVASVLDWTAGTGHDFIILGEWLPDLTRRIGNNDALHAAIEALLVTHRNLIDRQTRDDAAQAEAYGQALQALKAEISVDRGNFEADTICAALALCSVEVSHHLLHLNSLLK